MKVLTAEGKIVEGQPLSDIEEETFKDVELIIYTEIYSHRQATHLATQLLSRFKIVERFPQSVSYEDVQSQIPSIVPEPSEGL